MSTPNKEKPDFDEEFDQAVTQWRERHKLHENDAVLLLVELFRIHQHHWDQLRRREMPSFEQFRSDIEALTGSAKTFQQQAVTLIETLKKQPMATASENVTFTAAVFAVIAALLGGYLIGKAWP